VDDAYHDSRFASDSSEVDVTADIHYIHDLGKHSILKSGANRAVLVWHQEVGSARYAV